MNFACLFHICSLMAIPAKKIPIEHILASSKSNSRNGAGDGQGSRQAGVNLNENGSQTKDACNC